MANAFFAWRNLAAELGTITSDTSWNPGFPLSNILQPRPGVIAERSMLDDDPFAITVTFPSDGVPLDIVALIGTNLVGANQTTGSGLIEIEVEDTLSNIAVFRPLDVAWWGERDVQQYVVADLSDIPFSMSGPGGSVNFGGIVRLAVKLDPVSTANFGTRDPFLPDVSDPAAARFGTLFAGPAWRPANGIALADSAQSLIDNGERVDALDGAKFGRPRGKTRRFDGAFALLEQEEYAAAPRGFREFVGYCGRTRPLLCYPGQGFDPVYGFLADAPSWTSVDKNADKGVMARARIAVDEAI